MKAKTRRGITRRDRHLAKASEFRRLPKKAGYMTHGTAQPINVPSRINPERLEPTRHVERESVGDLRVPLGDFKR